jgi:hypothetical protein
MQTSVGIFIYHHPFIYAEPKSTPPAPYSPKSKDQNTILNKDFDQTIVSVSSLNSHQKEKRKN